MEQNEFVSAVDREETLEKEIADLREKIAELEGEESRLKLQAEYEQSDVDELEGKTLKAAFYTLIGKKNEKLNQEYDEADEAKARYEAVVADLSAARKALSRAEYALRRFRSSQKEEKEAFEAWLAETRARLKSLPPEVSREFLRLEQELMTHVEQQEQILVAIAEGKKAIRLSEYVAESMREIEAYNRRGYSLEEYELRREEEERRKMMGIQKKRFLDALMRIDLRNSEISSLKNIGNWVSPLLGELNELLKLRREKQEQVMNHIKKLIEEGNL